jgi:hypothetical protein
MEALEIQITGTIKSSNFPIWKTSLLGRIRAINQALITDDDFAVATDDAKALKKAEELIKEAKVRAIAQTEEIQSLFAALDEISERAREARLTLERQIKVRKQEIKEGLIEEAISEVGDHIAEQPTLFRQLNHEKFLQRHQYEAAIKGKSTVSGLKRALGELVRQLRDAIDEEVRRVMHNRAIIDAIPRERALLFQDVVYLVTLAEDDLCSTIENRLARVAEQEAITRVSPVEQALESFHADVMKEPPLGEREHYTVLIDLLCSRQEAVEAAQAIRASLSSGDILVDARLTRARN